MPNPPPPIVPNFNPGVGRLATDRYDFEAHIEGTKFRHKADQIDLFPTLVINSTPVANVQTALEAIIGALVAPVIQDASLTQKGIIQLAGDLAGLNSTAAVPRVGGIQGFPISTLAPTLNQVLTWNGSAWVPAAFSGAFTAGGDLTGSSSVQRVVALTGSGSSPNKIVSAANDIISFIASAHPYITQDYAAGIDGVNTVIKAQGVVSGTGKGGALVLAGGKPNGGSLLGGVSLTIGGDPATSDAGQYVAQATEVVSSQVVAAFFPPNTTTGLTSADMPVNTGSEVIFIGNAATAPTAPAGSTSGAILYSQTGKLNIMQGNGLNFTIEPNGGRAYYGNGSDHNLHFDGVATVLGIAPQPGGTYPLASNVCAANITIDLGITVITNGFIIQCTGTLTLNGTINNSGTSASGTTGGAGAPYTLLGGGSDGGSGLHFSVAQSGVNFAAVGTNNNLGLGGLGGAGGNPANVGGSLNNIDPTAFDIRRLTLSNWFTSSFVGGTSAFSAPVIIIFGAGSGGGGGASPAGGPAVDGGAGGGGGGIILVAANVITGSGFIISRGGDGANTAGWAGGGGGGGGVIIIISTDTSGWTGGANPSGGNPGVGPHGPGMPGMPGFVSLCQG